MKGEIKIARYTDPGNKLSYSYSSTGDNLDLAKTFSAWNPAWCSMHFMCLKSCFYWLFCYNGQFLAGARQVSFDEKKKKIKWPFSGCTLKYSHQFSLLLFHSHVDIWCTVEKAMNGLMHKFRLDFPLFLNLFPFDFVSCAKTVKASRILSIYKQGVSCVLLQLNRACKMNSTPVCIKWKDLFQVLVFKGFFLYAYKTELSWIKTLCDPLVF